MNKKLLAAVLGLIIIAAALIFFGGRGGTGALGEGIALYRAAWDGVPSAQGYAYIPFSATDEGYSFVNVALDVNGDGAYEGYETQYGRQEERLVVNDYPEVVEGSANRFAFLIVDPDFGKEPMRGTVVLSERAFPEGAWPAEFPGRGAEQKDFTASSVILEDREANRMHDGTGELATGIPSFGSILGTPVYAHLGEVHTALAAGAAAPYVKHDGVYDQDQRWNECAPTAITNSFRFLADKYGLADLMPKGDVQDITDELKGDLRWDDGVTHRNMISGKQAFIVRHGLPLEAHQIGAEDDPNLISLIAQEIAKGQAVEAWLSFENASGTAVGAHLVTVAGAGSKDGRDIITFTDPDTGSPDGRGSRDVYRVNPTNYLPTYAPGLKTFIRYAYAQSPIQSLTDGTWTDPRGKEIGKIGEGGYMPVGPGTTRSAPRSKFGFFEATLPHPGDQYVGTPFTYEVAVTERGIERVRTYRDAGGALREWRYGVGRPWNIRGAFRASGPLSPASVGNRPAPMDVPGDRATAAERFTCTEPGIATITYEISLSWPQTGGAVPAPIANGPHGAEFRETSDTMRAESPPFRCLPAAGSTGASSGASVLDSFCPGFTEDPDGALVDVLRKGDECYPTIQFHTAGPDKCDADHWHANAGTAQSLSGKMWADPSGCGLGRISEVPAGKVRLSPDQAAPYIGDAPSR